MVLLKEGGTTPSEHAHASPNTAHSRHSRQLHRILDPFGLLGKAGEAVSGAVEDLGQRIDQGAQHVGNLMQRGASSINSAFKTHVNQMQEGLEEAGKVAGMIGEDLVDSVSSLVSNRLQEERGEEAVRKREGVVDGFLRLVGIDSSQVGLMALNVLIFLAELMDAMLREAQDPGLPRAIIQKLQRATGDDTACVQLLVCKLSPVVWGLQRSVAVSQARSRDPDTPPMGLMQTLYEALPPLNTFVNFSESCEHHPTPSTHADTHTPPTLLEGGKDKTTSVSSVPRLAPVYPILNTTLGILSFAAFAVYIAMLLGGLLGGEGPAREAVNRRGEAAPQGDITPNISSFNNTLQPAHTILPSLHHLPPIFPPPSTQDLGPLLSILGGHELAGLRGNTGNFRRKPLGVDGGPESSLGNFSGFPGVPKGSRGVTAARGVMEGLKKWTPVAPTLYDMKVEVTTPQEPPPSPPPTLPPPPHTGRNSTNALLQSPAGFLLTQAVTQDSSTSPFFTLISKSHARDTLPHALNNHSHTRILPSLPTNATNLSHSTTPKVTTYTLTSPRIAINSITTSRTQTPPTAPPSDTQAKNLTNLHWDRPATAAAIVSAVRKITLENLKEQQGAGDF
ncbi:hypothetical protein O3P69_018532 [Scylla paramamosain]|uniref:Uncharacterized protein n=1 Tax=Scylla paramamosain TaxID=85552 RepID=A0AAW0T1G9_SCYPA